MIQKIVFDDAGEFGDPEDTWLTKKEIIESYGNANFEASVVGYVVHEDDDSVILALGLEAQYKQYTTPFRVPKKMIIKRIDLDVADWQTS